MHNARVMGALQKMLQTGGRTIWVAPSGGRDRPSTRAGRAAGRVRGRAVRPQVRRDVPADGVQGEGDADALLGPVAMLTHRLIPPPAKVESGGVDQGGEKREALARERRGRARATSSTSTSSSRAAS